MSSRTARFALIAPLVLLVACGSRTDLAVSDLDAAVVRIVDSALLDGGVDSDASDTGIISPPAQPKQGFALAACGPTDGPAEFFAFAPDALICPAFQDAPASADAITVYSQITGPSTITFSPSGPGGQGMAQSCTNGVCVDALDVSLTLTTYSPTGTTATGSYELQMVDGTTASGTFAVPICQTMPTCG
jgi:hypothetical protein